MTHYIIIKRFFFQILTTMPPSVESTSYTNECVYDVDIIKIVAILTSTPYTYNTTEFQWTSNTKFYFKYLFNDERLIEKNP